MKSVSCIMVVDDSEPDQFICKMTIQKEHPELTILQAYDGQEALELLSSTTQKPDIIFLDINMPGMDGHEFLAEYSKGEKNSATIIVMLTSSEQKEDKERCMSYEVVKRYMTKPLKPTDIAEVAALVS